MRPESITIHLLNNDKLLDKHVVTETEEWSWHFANLPKYEAGVLIHYTISEEPVNGYKTEISGYDVRNIHVPSEVSVEVRKVWEDEDDLDKMRPERITIALYADGKLLEKTLTLDAENFWTGQFKSLPEYMKGRKIVYTLEEIKVEGYTVSITGNREEGFVITNTHTPTKPTEPSKPIPSVTPEPTVKPIPPVPSTGENRGIYLWLGLLLLLVTGIILIVRRIFKSSTSKKT